MPDSGFGAPPAAGGFGAPAAGGFGGPQDGFGAPPAVPQGVAGAPVQGGFPGAPAAGGFPGAPAGVGGGFYAEESKATTALVIAIVGFIICGPLAIVGGIMGYTERKAIAEGRRDPAGQGKATAALAIGAIVAVLIVLAVIAIILIATLGSTT